MTPRLIIDGYNLMHAAGLALRSYGPGELEACRQRLLQLLSDRLPLTQRRRTRVVFDARNPTVPGTAPRRVFDMLICFAGDDGDADLAIEEMIQSHSAPRTLCVVSGDRRLQRAARRRRSQFVDGPTFLRLLRRMQAERAWRAPELPPQKLSGRLSADELKFWMAEFADVEVPRPDSSTAKPGTRGVSDHGSRAAGTAGGPKRQRPPATRTDEVSQTRFDNELAFWEQRLSEVLAAQHDTND